MSEHSPQNAQPFAPNRTNGDPQASPIRNLAEQARAAARTLAPLSLELRNAALTAIADALDTHHKQLLAANAHDLRLADAVQLILGREAVAELLTLSSLVDLVIPRGSRALVEHIQATTRIPVLGHADGICHVYIDRAADLEQALSILDDSKTDYPAVCNAAETALIHADVAPTFLPVLAQRLAAKGVTLLGDQPVRDLLQQQKGSEIGEVEDWHTEYGDLTLALRIVPSLSAAIEHIHQYGSAHTEAICTTDPVAAERFLNEIDASSVLHNASTRFADGFRFGLGAEVGVSTSRIHARGPVGLEGLTTTKYVVRGQGHLVADYRGPNARPFTHHRTSSR